MYPDATIASAGCGPTAFAMGMERLGVHMTPEEAARIAIECGARGIAGTLMRPLCEWASRKYGFQFLTTNVVDEIPFNLRYGKGDVVVFANVTGDRQGHKGVFSNEGHHILLLDAGKTEYLVADPADYEGKFDKPGREGVERIRRGLLKCKQSIVHEDCGERFYNILWKE